MRKPALYKFLLLVCLLQSILKASAQNDKLMELCELAEQPMYILYNKDLCYNYDDYLHFSFLGYNKIEYIPHHNLKNLTNKDQVYRLTVLGDAYIDVSISMLDFPNLQELNIIDDNFIPKNLDKFKNLQILVIADCSGRKREVNFDIIQQAYNLGYLYAPVFPKEITNLSKLRILLFYPDYDIEPVAPMLIPDLSRLQYLDYLMIKNHSKWDTNYNLPHVSLLLNENIQISNYSISCVKKMPDCFNDRAITLAAEYYGSKALKIIPKGIQSKETLQPQSMSGKYLQLCAKANDIAKTEMFNLLIFNGFQGIRLPYNDTIEQLVNTPSAKDELQLFVVKYNELYTHTPLTYNNLEENGQQYDYILKHFEEHEQSFFEVMATIFFATEDFFDEIILFFETFLNKPIIPLIVEVQGVLRKGVVHGKYKIYTNGELTQERFYNKGIEIDTWIVLQKSTNEYVNTNRKCQYFFTNGIVDSVHIYTGYVNDSLYKIKETTQFLDNKYENRKQRNYPFAPYSYAEYKNNAIVYTWSYFDELVKEYFDKNCKIQEIFHNREPFFVDFVVFSSYKSLFFYHSYYYNADGELRYRLNGYKPDTANLRYTLSYDKRNKLKDIQIDKGREEIEYVDKYY